MFQSKLVLTTVSVFLAYTCTVACATGMAVPLTGLTIKKGGPLVAEPYTTVGGNPYIDAIDVNSSVEFRLDRKYDWFIGYVAADDTSDPDEKVSARISVDAKEMAVLDASAFAQPKPFKVRVTGGMRLLVTDACCGNNFRLVKACLVVGNLDERKTHYPDTIPGNTSVSLLSCSDNPGKALVPKPETKIGTLSYAKAYDVGHSDFVLAGKYDWLVLGLAADDEAEVNEPVSVDVVIDGIARITLKAIPFREPITYLLPISGANRLAFASACCNGHLRILNPRVCISEPAKDTAIHSPPSERTLKVVDGQVIHIPEPGDYKVIVDH